MKLHPKKFALDEEAILTTILYSDIFSFPPTRDELWKFLISNKKITQKKFASGLKNLDTYITAKDGYFCLKNREEIIAKRKRYLPEVSKKIERAQDISAKLSRIPSILFIGVSGGLAVGNVTAEDDIDLIIIVKKNTLFMTRLLILTVLESLGVRRYRKQKHAADTICANLLFDETALNWFSQHKDIYTAREIAQIRPLFERENTYRKFLSANSWMRDFLPNITIAKLKSHPSGRSDKIFFNSFFESISRTLQMRWMKRHQTTETVTKHVLAFHPNDYRVKSVRKLRLKMRELGLLTIF